MTRGDKFKHIRKKGILLPVFLNNTLSHLFMSHMERCEKKQEMKMKHEGPASSWPCKIKGCRNPRHIENYGKVRPYCSEHYKEYNREKAKAHRLLDKKRIGTKKNALPE